MLVGAYVPRPLNLKENFLRKMETRRTLKMQKNGLSPGRIIAAISSSSLFWYARWRADFCAEIFPKFFNPFPRKYAYPQPLLNHVLSSSQFMYLHVSFSLHNLWFNFPLNTQSNALGRSDECPRIYVQVSNHYLSVNLLRSRASHRVNIQTLTTNNSLTALQHEKIVHLQIPFSPLDLLCNF